MEEKEETKQEVVKKQKKVAKVVDTPVQYAKAIQIGDKLYTAEEVICMTYNNVKKIREVLGG